jgi:reactive intermediate/imine deaminase
VPDKTVITPAGVAVPPAPLSLGVKAAGLIFVSGQVALDARGEVAGEGDIRAQTTQVLDNLKAIVEEAGGSLADVVKTTVYMVDFGDYAGMNEVYSRYFPSEPPARATVRADLVNPAFLVEIDAYAVVG